MCIQGIPWQWSRGWDSVLLMQRAQVPSLSLVRELRSYLLLIVAKKKKKKPPKNMYLNCIIAVCIPQLNYHLGRCLDCSCSPSSKERDWHTVGAQ